jgi:hypothetical protein
MSDFKLCQSCCKKESLEIIILIENIAAMAGRDLKGSYAQLNYWGGQAAPKSFGTVNQSASSYIDNAFYGSLYGYSPPTYSFPSSNYGSSQSSTSFCKGEMSQDVVIEILRKIKKTNLKLKSSIIIYIYKNNAWVQAILSPKTIIGKDNTITLVHWPYFKSPGDDNDPVGIKTYGTLAAEANQDSSFSAILSEGRGNSTYTQRTKFFGHPTARNFDFTLGFVRGFKFSSTLDGSENAPTITNKGSFFTFTRSNDTQKIYYSTNSGYVDTAYYTGQWPVNFGQVTEEDVPSTISSFGSFWNYEYYPRIPESEKDKILFRDVKVAFADYNDYINKQSDAQNCVPYYNSFDEQVDFPLCYPNCLRDNRDSPQGCPNPSLLRATDATATIENGGVKFISIDPGLKGVYNCAPTIQIISNNKSGVGAIAIQKDGQNITDALNQLFKPSSAPEIRSKGFGYTTPPEIVYQKVLDEKSIFSENFSSIGYGSNTNINYSNWTGWTGNQNFPSVNDIFQAKGAIYLSGSSSYIETKNIGLDFPAGNFAISFDVKGRYSPVEPPNNILKIEITGSTDLKTDISYTASINDQFESKYVEFTASKNKRIKFSPAGTGELFLTNIKVYGPGDAAAGYERGWVLRADFTKNFDDIYAAMPYNYLNDYWKYGKGGKGDNLYGFASQGLSAIKNACLKFSQSSKKMIIFVADSFIAYKGAINDTTQYRADNPVYGASPYPSKEEIKNLLSEKNIRLHAITFNGTRLSYLRDNQSNPYDNLSLALKAYAPYNGIGLGIDNNTVSGYVSPIEEITNAKKDLYNNASGNRLWVFGTENANNANDFDRINRDYSITNNGIPSNNGGGRILQRPSTWQDISTGIFYEIKVLLNEISGVSAQDQGPRYP